MDKRKVGDLCGEVEAVKCTGSTVTCGASQCVNFCGTIVAKNRVHINRRWSDFYCLNDKMATIYLSYQFHSSDIIHLRQSDAELLDR